MPFNKLYTGSETFLQLHIGLESPLGSITHVCYSSDETLCKILIMSHITFDKSLMPPVHYSIMQKKRHSVPLCTNYHIIYWWQNLKRQREARWQKEIVYARRLPLRRDGILNLCV